MVLPLSGDHRRWPDLGLLPLSEAERGRSEAFPGQGPQIQCVSRVHPINKTEDSVLNGTYCALLGQDPDSHSEIIAPHIECLISNLLKSGTQLLDIRVQRDKLETASKKRAKAARSVRLTIAGVYSSRSGDR